MKVTPVVYYKKPGYPTGADMKSRPELLKKVPDRWSRNGMVLTALGMSLALCACAARGDAEPGGVKTEIQNRELGSRKIRGQEVQVRTTGAKQRTEKLIRGWWLLYSSMGKGQAPMAV